MDAFVYLIFILAVCYAIFWCAKNDGLQSIEDQKGYFKMKCPPSTVENKENSDDSADDPYGQ